MIVMDYDVASAYLLKNTGNFFSLNCIFAKILSYFMCVLYLFKYYSAGFLTCFFECLVRILTVHAITFCTISFGTYIW